MNDNDLAQITHDRVMALVTPILGPGIDNGTTTRYGTPEVRFPCRVHGQDKPDSDGLRFSVNRDRPDEPHWWCPKCEGTGLRGISFLDAQVRVGIPWEATLPTYDLTPAGEGTRQPATRRSRPCKEASPRTPSPLPDEDAVARWAEALHGPECASALRYLVEMRLWSPDWIDRLQIGWDFGMGGRFTIPVRDGDGDLLAVRTWIPKAQKGKRRHWLGHTEHVALWPASVLESLRPGSNVLLTAGEGDAVAALSQGWAAVTSMYGEEVDLKAQDIASLASLNVVIVYDSDDAGRTGAARELHKLQGVAASVRAVDLFPDRADGSDLTDWLRMQKARPGRMPQAALSVLIRQEETPNGNAPRATRALRGNSSHAPTVRRARSSATKGHRAP